MKPTQEEKLEEQVKCQADFILLLEKELETEHLDDQMKTLEALKRLKRKVDRLELILSQLHEIKKIPFEVYKPFI